VEERIAKVMARAGVASRRDAEKMIEAGRVTLDGEVVASPALNVLPDADIRIDGEPLPQKERTRLWLFHKPRGLVTTARDPEGRPTVFDSLPAELPRVVAVGRLDINTEGLLLLTNDGGLARVLAHPTTGWLRRYKVRAYGDINQATLDGLRDGISIDGVDYGPIEARLDREQGDNTWLTLGLREGKNREIKVILEHLGLQVNRLIRMSFGPFQLGELEMGLVEEIPTRILRDQLGEALAQEAGVDFASPVREPVDELETYEERRPERRDERPARGRTGEDRPRRSRDDERPARARFNDERPARGGKPERRGREPERDEAPARPARRTAWRADEDAAEPKGFKPRRKADPATERAANAERPRERVGAIKGSKGGKVLVERLVAKPKAEADERPARKPRPPRGDDAPQRSRPRSDERPARADGDRARHAGGDRPPRTEGGRPPRDARPPRDGAPPRRGPPPGGRGGPPKGRRT
jgi:23S rRNA pseudouridine2605 synthase